MTPLFVVFITTAIGASIGFMCDDKLLGVIAGLIVGLVFGLLGVLVWSGPVGSVDSSDTFDLNIGDFDGGAD